MDHWGLHSHQRGICDALIYESSIGPVVATAHLGQDT
jgi:hypothetical protein